MCSVGVVPGATASTRIPDGPSSTAIDLVRWLIAAFGGAVHAQHRRRAHRLTRADVHDHAAAPAATIARASAAEHSSVAVRFWSTIVRT